MKEGTRARRPRRRWPSGPYRLGQRRASLLSHSPFGPGRSRWRTALSPRSWAYGHRFLDSALSSTGCAPGDGPAYFRNTPQLQPTFLVASSARARRTGSCCHSGNTAFRVPGGLAVWLAKASDWGWAQKWSQALGFGVLTVRWLLHHGDHCGVFGGRCLSGAGVGSPRERRAGLRSPMGAVGAGAQFASPQSPRPDSFGLQSVACPAPLTGRLGQISFAT